jgi:hypothetical protein
MCLCLAKDTYRAAWALQILLAPERIPGMVKSMLQDYKEVCHTPLSLRYIFIILCSGWLAAYVEKHRRCVAYHALERALTRYRDEYYGQLAPAMLCHI